MSIATCLFSFNLDISDMIKLYSSWVKHFLIASNKLQWKHFFHNVSSKHENAITITKVQQEGHINKTNHVLPQVHVRTQDWIPFRKKPTSLRIVIYVRSEKNLTSLWIVIYIHSEKKPTSLWIVVYVHSEITYIVEDHSLHPFTNNLHPCWL